MAPGTWPVAAAAGLLGAASIGSAAAVLSPARRRALGAASAGLALGAGAILLGGLWRQLTGGGVLPHPSWFEASVEALVGLSLSAAFLAGGTALQHGGSDAAPALKATAAAALLGAAFAACTLRWGDPEPLFVAPASRSSLACLHYTLHWTSLGLLLAAPATAAAFLLDFRADAAALRSWDPVLRGTVVLGLPPFLASMVLGAIWHRGIWSSPWSWEVGETWSLATALLFTAWLHLRQAAPEARRSGAALLVAGGLLIAGWWAYIGFLPGTVDSLEYFTG